MLYDKIKHFTIEDAVKIEESDRQFKALKNLYENIKDKHFFLPLIIANSLVCYQLSSTWEEYWEEFAKKWSNKEFKSSNDTIEFLKDFLPNSKWNKRLLAVKLKRLDKIAWFLHILEKKDLYYYNNMAKLRDELSQIMNQKKDAKTIVFAVKMFSYWARVRFEQVINFPFEIEIPIDSRIIKLYEVYREDSIKIWDFYKELSQRTNIPPLHLDAILWVNYNKLINNE